MEKPWRHYAGIARGRKLAVLAGSGGRSGWRSGGTWRASAGRSREVACLAAAKSAGFLDVALDCARRGTTEPATLLRAARDFVESEPRFAAQIALQAITDLWAGKGYEPTTLDLLQACDHFIAASARCSDVETAEDTLRRVLHEAEVEGSDPTMREAMNRRLGILRQSPRGCDP